MAHAQQNEVQGDVMARIKTKGTVINTAKRAEVQKTRNFTYKYFYYPRTLQLIIYCGYLVIKSLHNSREWESVAIIILLIPHSFPEV